MILIPRGLLSQTELGLLECSCNLMVVYKNKDVQMVRLSIRETLMLMTIVALAIPYVLPKWQPEKHPPSLLDISMKDLEIWAKPYLQSTNDFRLIVTADSGSSIATQNGDTEITVPPGNVKAILSAWNQSIHIKLDNDDWTILKSWEGKDWFEYEVLKDRSIRRIFCSIRPLAGADAEEKLEELDRVRLVWLNSGFSEGKTDSRVQ